MIAAFIAIIPLYLIGMGGNYLATQLVLSFGFGQSSGTYLHYFHEFLVPIDIFYSVLKAVIFVVMATLIHCYFGFSTPPAARRVSARRPGGPSAPASSPSC